MKLLSAGSLAMGTLLLSSALTFGQVKTQGNSKEKDKLESSQQLIIKWKTDGSIDTKGEKGEKGSKGSKGSKGPKDVKLVIELKDDAILVNGKPLEDFNDDELAILKKDILVMDGNTFDLVVPGGPRSAFRGGNWSWSGDGPAVVGYGPSNRPFLGVGSEKTDKGVVITTITDGSAADKAGLKEGDIITKIDASPITSPDQLSTTIQKYKPDTKVTVSIKREGHDQKLTATLGRRTEGVATTYPGMDDQFKLRFDGFMVGQPRLGIKAQDTEDGRGVEVIEVDEESAAEKAGIKEGDIITSFDGSAINSVDELVDRSRAAKDAKKVSFPVKFLRDNKEQQVDIKMPRKLKTAEL